MTDPRHVAYFAVQQAMDKGKAKHTTDWQAESQDFHIDKAIRHTVTYRLIRDGHQTADDEDHLHNAICRLAMALACAIDKP